MNNKTIGMISFILGAAVGSIATWLCVKSHYEQIADEEIDSVIEQFTERDKEREKKETDKKVNDEIINDMSYALDDVLMEDEDEPYVIPPEDCGSLYGYDVECLTYYADGVVANDMDEVLEDEDHVIGSDYMHHFGEYDDDSVFIRNDRLKIDYEIVRDLRTYAEVTSNDPHKVETE